MENTLEVAEQVARLLSASTVYKGKEAATLFPPEWAQASRGASFIGPDAGYADFTIEVSACPSIEVKRGIVDCLTKGLQAMGFEVVSTSPDLSGKAFVAALVVTGTSFISATVEIRELVRRRTWAVELNFPFFGGNRQIDLPSMVMH